MIDTPDDLLLQEAEHLARDLLLTADTKPRTLPGLITGWERLIPAAAAITGTQAPNPLSQVLQISVAIRRDANDWIGPASADSRLDRMRQLLVDVTTAPGSPGVEARLSEATLHACYLATHAVSSSLMRHAYDLLRDTKTRPHGLLVKSLGQRIQIAEHILDSELHDPGLTVSGPTDAARALRQRISGWDQELHAALAGRTPDPRVLLVSANVAAGLLRATAELAQRAARQDTTASFDVETRLLPVLVAAIDSWDRSRETWRILAPAASGIPRPLANAAQRLYDALHDPALDTHADSHRALRLAITATVEAAHLQVQATRRADVRGAASGVAALTRNVFDHVPGAQSLDLWNQLERLNGPALISIPTPVRTELLGEATVTLATTTTAASASYALSRGPGGHRGRESDHHGQVRPWHAHTGIHPGQSHAPRL